MSNCHTLICVPFPQSIFQTMMSMLGRNVLRRRSYSKLPLTTVALSVRRWHVNGLHDRGFHAFVAKSFECTPSALDGPGRKSKVKIDKPYKCTHDGCDRGFGTPNGLERHLPQHDMSRKHVCSYCQLRFTTTGQSQGT